MVVPAVVGSGGGSSSANHAFSGQRRATTVIERFGVSLTRATTLSTSWKAGNAYVSRLSQGCREAFSKRAWGSGIREQYRGSLALRCVANRSSAGDPHLRSRSLATCGWSDHSAPRTWLRQLSRSARTLDCPGRYLASSWTLLDSIGEVALSTSKGSRRLCPRLFT